MIEELPLLLDSESSVSLETYLRQKGAKSFKDQNGSRETLKLCLDVIGPILAQALAPHIKDRKQSKAKMECVWMRLIRMIIHGLKKGLEESEEDEEEKTPTESQGSFEGKVKAFPNSSEYLFVKSAEVQQRPVKSAESIFCPNHSTGKSRLSPRGQFYGKKSKAKTTG